MSSETRVWDLKVILIVWVGGGGVIKMIEQEKYITNNNCLNTQRN